MDRQGWPRVHRRIPGGWLHPLHCAQAALRGETAMPRHIVILGGGVGGTILANVLARRLTAEEAEVTLIDSSGMHVYMPAWLYIPFSDEPVSRRHFERPVRSLLNHRVHLVIGEVTRIDPQRRELTVQHGANRDDIR